MSGKPAARVTDPTSCPLPGHGTNPIASGSSDVFFDGLAAARKSDKCTCGAAIVGAVSQTVFINGLNAAVVGSTGDHGSVVVGGSGTVIIGDSVVNAPVSAVKAMAATALAAGAAYAATAGAQPAALAAAAPAPIAAAVAAPADRIQATVEILAAFDNSTEKKRVFNDPAHPLGTPEDPFEKDKIYYQLKSRVARAHGHQASSPLNPPALPDQSTTSLCGPATFFYALLMDRPDLYTQAIIDLWETGETTIGTLHIKPSHGACNPKNFSEKNENDRIWAIDWISLASLRDSENMFLDYDSPLDQLAGITLPGKIADWFTKAGASVVFENVQYTSHLNQQQLVELFGHIDPQHHVATLIGAGMLENGEGSSKNHWITWEQGPATAEGEVTPTTAPGAAITGSQLFTWGQVGHLLAKNLTLQSLLKHLYGGLVFSKIP